MSSYKILSWPKMIMHTVGSTDIQSTTCSARGKQCCWQDGSSRQKINLLCKISKSSYILLFDYGLWALPSNPVSHSQYSYCYLSLISHVYFLNGLGYYFDTWHHSNDRLADAMICIAINHSAYGCLGQFSIETSYLMGWSMRMLFNYFIIWISYGTKTFHCVRCNRNGILSKFVFSCGCGWPHITFDVCVGISVHGLHARKLCTFYISCFYFRTPF